MDAYEIVRHLNQVLDLCDSLDQSGEIGVIGLTNGKTTSREALRLQLGFFLLYIGGSNGYLTDGETALINVHEIRYAFDLYQLIGNNVNINDDKYEISASDSECKFKNEYMVKKLKKYI